MTDASRFEIVDAAAWDALLERHDVRDAYLRSGYVEATACIEEGAPLYLVLPGADGSAVGCALLLRNVPEAECERAGIAQVGELITPYGYGGPVVLGAGAPIDEFRAGFAPWAAGHGAVSAFFRFHPLLDTASNAPAGTDIVPLVGTVAWDLSADRDLEAGMHSRHRRLVRKARREGVTMSVTRGHERLAEFRTLYDVTMRRQAADDFYFFGDAYWQGLADAFGEDLVFVMAELDGEAIAGLMLFAGSPFLHYHLGATADAARSNGASNLCFLTAAEWGQAERMTRLHLGGGVGGSADGLYDFKLRFDPDHGAIDCAIGKLVCAPQQYEQLAGTTATDGYFPAWRRPQPVETPAEA